MNAALLLEHYAQIADAPDAIARLRRFILDLAVRGKLVEQDPNDEPASELLKRSHKRALTGRKAAMQDVMAEAPYDLPSSWSWVPVSAAFQYDAGRKVEPKALRSDAWLLELEDIEKDTGRLLNRSLVSERSPQSTKSEFTAGDILYGKLRPYLNKVIVAGEGGYSTTEIVALRPLVDTYAPYCALAFRRPDYVDYVSRLGQGTKMPRLRTEDALISPFPLPPLAEQHRIVAKVDELIALCDQLETAQGERETGRDKLTLSTFAKLNEPDPETFAADASFALEHLEPLTERTDQIKQLRETILNLAVRGKLVEQDPNDEPASELLKRIEIARTTRAKAAGVRSKRPIKISESNAPSIVPASWALEALGNLVDPSATISYGVLVPGPDVEDGIPFVRAQDLSLSGHAPRPNKTIAPEVEASYARTRLKGGEILLCVVGSIGKLGIAPASWAGANIARAVARIAPIDLIASDYILLAMRSELVQRQFTEATRTLAQPTLNVSLIEAVPIPLPPLAEQHRIVAKVDELMSLCDQLEDSLVKGEQTRSKLLEAVLHEALEPE